LTQLVSLVVLDCIFINKILKCLQAGNADRYADTLPIHSAAMGGNVSIIKFLAIAGSSLETGRREGDRTGVRPLHVCAEHGHVKAVQALADLGADLNATDSFAFTPLHLAASEGHADVIECLLRAGANARMTAAFHNERGVTPLHLAVRFGHKKAVSALLPSTEASDGGAAGATGTSATCDVNAAQSAESITGYTALHIAATEGHVTIARLLLKAGADSQLKISTGKTAYDLAKNKGFTDVMKIIKFMKVGKEQ
jgi:ankyrin repeat protein